MPTSIKMFTHIFLDFSIYRSLPRTFHVISVQNSLRISVHFQLKFFNADFNQNVCKMFVKIWVNSNFSGLFYLQIFAEDFSCDISPDVFPTYLNAKKIEKNKRKPGCEVKGGKANNGKGTTKPWVESFAGFVYVSWSTGGAFVRR